MLLTHLKIQNLELVCISSISILLQCPFQFHQRCNDSKAMAITSISVTRPMADECSEDYFNQDLVKLITKTGLKRVLIFFLINIISIDYGMQFETIDFTSWQKRKFWKKYMAFWVATMCVQSFSISSSVSFQQQTVADTANGVTDLASAANAWVAILPSMANVNVSLAFYMVACFNFVCYWYRLKVIAWSGFTHQVQHL